MLRITRTISIPNREIEISAIRAPGPGGQNVNKVSSATHLRFDSQTSSLPESCKQKFLRSRDQRITKEGVVNIKASEYRSQTKNREEALERLRQLIRRMLVVPKARKPTKPTHGSRLKRLASKTRHGQLKRLRRKQDWYE